jgi:hypothetical protein
VKFNLPLNRSVELEGNLILSKEINHRVLSSIYIYIDAIKIPISFEKQENGYVQKLKLRSRKKGKNTVISIGFNFFIEEGTKHTIGINSLEIL